MRIHVYTVCWNERLMLPYFLRHYGPFCERVIVYDNGSDDGSQQMVAAHPGAEVRHMESGGEFREDVNTRVKETCWRESSDRPDWVIVCDIDELLYHPRLLHFLDECRKDGVTIPVPTAWQMVSDRFPETNGQIYEEVRRGFVDPFYNKRMIFNPAAIERMNYEPGCHYSRPEGNIRERVDPALKLLHYKFLGLEYVSARYAAFDARMGEFNREHGYGFQYSASAEAIEDTYLDYQDASREVPFDEGAS